MTVTRGDRPAALKPRLAALGGFVFVAIQAVILLALARSPQPPGPLASALTLSNFYYGHWRRVLAPVYLDGVAGIFFLAFLSSLRRALERDESEDGVWADAAFGAGIIALVMALVLDVLDGALAARLASQSDNGVIVGVFAVRTMVFNLSWFPLAALVGASALAAWGSRLMPPPYVWGSLILALIFLIAALSVFVASGPLIGLGPGAFVLFLLWVAATSWLLWRGSAGA